MSSPELASLTSSAVRKKRRSISVIASSSDESEVEQRRLLHRQQNHVALDQLLQRRRTKHTRNETRAPKSPVPESTSSSSDSDNESDQSEGLEDFIAPSSDVASSPILKNSKRALFNASNKTKRTHRRRALSTSSDREENDDSSSSTPPPLNPYMQDEPSQSIPIEFANISRQPIHESFRIVVQYLTSVIIDPDFAEMVTHEKDTYFLAALQKCQNAIGSKKESLVQSSVWVSEVKTAVDRRPYLETRILSDHEAGMLCDACRRKNRIASIEMTFLGPFYNHKTFQTEPGKNSSVHFKVGRFCAARLLTYHNLHHFWFTLKEKIQEFLDDNYHGDVEQENPRDVISWMMEQDQMVHSWYSEFKAALESANTYC